MRRGAYERLDLGRAQELNPLLGVARLSGLVDLVDGVEGDPASLDGERQEPVKEVDLVADGVRGEPRPALRVDERRHLLGPDRSQAYVTEEWHQMAVEHDPVVLDRGRLALEDVRQVREVMLADLGERLPAAARDHDRLRHQPAKCGLRLDSGQALAGSRLPLRAYPPLDSPAADPPRAVPGFPAAAVTADEQPS
jgi:hypothetical protein